MTLVMRDPFARTELHRSLVKVAVKCWWCGGDRGSGKLYEYRTESDGGRKGKYEGYFCDASCFNSYHPGG